MANKNQVTQKQAYFVRGYVKHGNAARAAREAGYAPKSARITACRLLTKANIQAEIAAERRRYELEFGLDRKSLTRELTSALDLAKLQADPAKMVAAAREIGLICGYYDQCL
jgi:phage terminase small subunit